MQTILNQIPAWKKYHSYQLGFCWSRVLKTYGNQQWEICYKAIGCFTEPKGRNADVNGSQEVEGCGETRKLSSSVNSLPPRECVNHFFLSTPSPALQVRVSESMATSKPKFTATRKNTESLFWFILKVIKRNPWLAQPLAHSVQIGQLQLYPSGIGQSSHQRGENPCCRGQPNRYLPQLLPRGNDSFWSL